MIPCLALAILKSHAPPLPPSNQHRQLSLQPDFLRSIYRLGFCLRIQQQGIMMGKEMRARLSKMIAVLQEVTVPASILTGVFRSTDQILHVLSAPALAK